MDLSKAKSLLPENFIHENHDLNEDVANALIAKAAGKIKEIKAEMKADIDLQSAQDVVKELKAPYKSIIQSEEAKISYLLSKIEDITSASEV